MIADQAPRRQKCDPLRVWIGVMPRDVTDPDDIESYVQTCARKSWISLAYYRIEIVEEKYGVFRSRAIYAVRRSAVDVIETL